MKASTLPGATAVAFAVAMAALAMPAGAQAQQAGAYPTKAIRMMVPFPPGGPSDAHGRPIATRMAQILGQPVVIENRGGAGGVVGSDMVAKAPADGYTLLFTVAGALAVAPSLTKLPYDPYTDLTPVAHALTVPEVIVMNPKLGLKTLPDLVAYARANPGKLSFGSAGNASMPHLAGELLKREANINIVHVPYRGSGPAVADLLAGHVDLMFSDVSVVLGQIQSGKLVPLAVGSARRVGPLPEVPTTAEAGHPRVTIYNWSGLLAPGGTPRDIVMKLNAAVKQALATPELQERFTREGAQVVASTPEEFAAFIRAEAAKWGTLAKAAGVKWE